jgi:CelD/BcsL family acetyltransferase involved in cellulose biosynthesis
MSEAELIADLPSAEAVAGDWDALAIASGTPMSSPAWMLGWWRHLAPSAAELRVVVVRDRGRIIGVVPFYVDLGRRSTARCYRLLANDLLMVGGPLGCRDREWEVAEATADLLGTPELRPNLLELGPMPASSPWSLALRERWPSRMRPLASHRLAQTAIVSIQGRSFDAWLAERSGQVRHTIRRRSRLFQKSGGAFRYADAQSISVDLETFATLHAARWHGQGNSRLVALGDRLTEFLGDVARHLLSDHRFRLLLLELDGQPICAAVSLAAGGEVVAFNTGWDEQHRRLSPPILALVHAIEDSCGRGERRVDLGSAGHSYKEQLANGRDVATLATLFPPGSQLPRALYGALPAIVSWRARQTTKRMLPDAYVSRLRDARAAVARGLTGLGSRTPAADSLHASS